MRIIITILSATLLLPTTFGQEDCVEQSMDSFGFIAAEVDLKKL